MTKKKQTKQKVVKLNSNNKFKRVLIGMPSASGLIPWQTVHSLLALHKPNIHCGMLVVERIRTDKARSQMAMQTLKLGYDYLFFIDDDNPIPADTLAKFVEDDKDIVSAPVLSRTPMKEGKFALCVFNSRKIKIDKQEIDLYRNIEKFRGKGPLHKVAAVGMGCTLIKREVLVKLHKKYKDDMFEFGFIKFKRKIKIDGQEYDRRVMSEDCEFSERAVKAGFEIYVDTRIRPFHIIGTQMNQWKE